MNKHLILIGFKHVGKSAVGKALAEKTGKQFLDLDEQIELRFMAESCQRLNCRQIMQSKGEGFFRDLESRVLTQILEHKPAVVSLGGGTPMRKNNQELLKPHQLILVEANKGTVFERIMVNGRPAFFSPEETPMESFNKLWEERKKVYHQLASITISNDGSVGEAAEAIISKLLLTTAL